MDNTELFHLLTDDWDDDEGQLVRTSPWTRDYLTHLTSLTLDELEREPTTLHDNQKKIKQEAQQLAFTEYPTFLHAQACRREMDAMLTEVDGHLSGVLDTLPQLEQAWDQFQQQSETLVKERAKVTSVLDYQNVLVDVLELPQLMDTCVWNGYYTEAMDLAAHVRRLRLRYPLAVMDSIQHQIQASSDVMLGQFIAHLRSPIKLAAAMNVIGYLRRMDAFSNDDLRIVFLRCRHDFVDTRIDKLKKDRHDRAIPAFDYLKRYIDILREHIFEVATQYMSIFSTKENDTLLTDYLTHLIADMQRVLTEELATMDDTSELASLLTQLQYCGLSLGRVGLDFRLLFVRAFEQAVQPLVLRLMDRALAALQDTLHPIIKHTTQPSNWLTFTASMASSIQHDAPASPSPSSPAAARLYQPPLLLIDYPCLATFTNGILTALNALRLVPALHLAKATRDHLHACLIKAANTLKTYADAARTQFPDEEDLVASFITTYARSCAPYLHRCLVEGIYKMPIAHPSPLKTEIDALLNDYLALAAAIHEQATAAAAITSEAATPVDEPTTTTATTTNGIDGTKEEKNEENAHATPVNGTADEPVGANNDQGDEAAQSHEQQTTVAMPTPPESQQAKTEHATTAHSQQEIRDDTNSDFPPPTEELANKPIDAPDVASLSIE
ncbi:Dor1-like family-domain-containing protein [Gongronella butleri]|nr:Dor1-like family-domain-containing protein [Gongronella butleri]